MNNQENNDIFRKCSRCLKDKNINEFKKKNDNYLKCCNVCINYNIKKHNKRKCIHKKQRFSCKICSKDAKILTFKNMVRNSIIYDKRYNLYDKDNTVDFFYICYLYVKQSNKCYYCSKNLHYIEYNKNLCSIERLNNNKNHSNKNCVLSCLGCNVSRVGSKIIVIDENTITDKEIRYELKEELKTEIINELKELLLKK